MFRLVVFVFWLLLPAGVALADADDSRSWFESLSAAERVATQADLILLGHLQRPADGTFETGTFEALAAFQAAEGAEATGVLDAGQRAALRGAADAVDAVLGMQEVQDRAAHAQMSLPARLLTSREPSEAGTAYLSADGQLSLVTMHTALEGQSFTELFAGMIAPDDERSVAFHEFDERRFIIGGMVGAYNFYTLFLNVGPEAIGYSLAWGSDYADEGPLTALWVASSFQPLAEEPAPAEERGPPSVPQPWLVSAFHLPEAAPEIIALNAEITGTTPRDFERALALRPEARIVVLNSPGGAVGGALAMAEEIRRRGLSTFVPAGLGCYSACAYVYFAGRQRQADGELGVHQISTDIDDLVSAQATLGDVLDALETFDVRQPVISFMLRTPPDDMHVFSAAEIADFGINRGAPITVALSAEDLVGSDVFAGGAVYVQLSRLSGAGEAQRSLAYLERRWGALFGGAQAEVAEIDGTFNVRLAVTSVEEGNAICTAIKADGGGCYLSGEW